MKLLPIALILLTALQLAAQEPSEAAKTKVQALTTPFQSSLSQTLAPATSPALAELNTKYLAALERGFAAATQSGNLEEALLWRAEKTRIEKNEPLPPTDPDTFPPTLRRMRQAYRDASAPFTTADYSAAAALFDQLDADLDALQVELTKNLAIDDALFVKTERERFAKLRAETIPKTAVIQSTLTLPQKPPALPKWLEQAAEVGGSLRIQGTLNGKPIDERSALKEFSTSDYVQVATGNNALVLGVRRRGNGQRTLLDKTAHGDTAIREFKNFQSLDRQHDSWLSDDNAYKDNCHQIGRDLDLGDSPIIRGGGDGHLIRLASGDWTATGHHWTNGETIKPALEPIRTLLKQDNATVLSSNLNRISWITKENRLREFKIDLRPGSATEVPVTSQPAEPIIDLLVGSSKTFGTWIALGRSGAVYAQATGGFTKPVPELTPAIALRGANGQYFHTIAARRPDGTWHAVGPNTELNEAVAAAGPAIDLDIHTHTKTAIVLWIEPKSTMLPR